MEIDATSHPEYAFAGSGAPHTTIGIASSISPFDYDHHRPPGNYVMTVDVGPIGEHLTWHWPNRLQRLVWRLLGVKFEKVSDG